MHACNAGESRINGAAKPVPGGHSDVRGGDLDFDIPDRNLRKSMPEDDSKYLAFISYSRADNEQEGRMWADWVKQTIEGFSIPINCEVAESAGDARPGLLREVFLDRSRLMAGGELMEQLEQHLKMSRFLVLICSPKSAASEFVGFEIDYFKNTGRANRIIPIVVDGKDSKSDPHECWVPANLHEMIPVTGDDGMVVATRERSLIYADFRTKEKLPNNTFLVEGGWTDPSFYEKLLIQQNFYAPQERARRVAAYRRIHSIAKYALLGGVFGLEPQQLAGEALLEDNERKTRTIRDNRKRFALLGAWVMVMTGMAAFAYYSYRIAEGERLKSERSLRLIGDAHENASRLVADVLVDLRAKLEPAGQAAAVDDAQRIVNEYFEDNELKGDDDDSLHMRSVVLNSRGYLARKTGDLSAAHEFYTKSLMIREQLLSRDGDKAMYLHNLAVSHDNLGDLHIARAISLRNKESEAAEEFEIAIAEYQKGLDISKQLAARKDATAEWRHSLAVSRFKVGDALYEAGYPQEALVELLAGFSIAEQVAAADPAYAKWQAHLGLYCLELGRIHAASANIDEATTYLRKGKKIFVELEDQGQLSRQYAVWRERIDAILLDLE